MDCIHIVNVNDSQFIEVFITPSLESCVVAVNRLMKNSLGEILTHELDIGAIKVTAALRLV